MLFLFILFFLLSSISFIDNYANLAGVFLTKIGGSVTGSLFLHKNNMKNSMNFWIAFAITIFVVNKLDNKNVGMLITIILKLAIPNVNISGLNWNPLLTNKSL